MTEAAPARSAPARLRRQRRIFEQAPGFIAILQGPTHVFEFVNRAYVRLAGEREFVGRSIRDALPEIEGQGYFELLDQVYATGERHVAYHVPVQLARRGDEPLEERFVDFIYAPLLDEAGKPEGIFVEGYDVTEVHRAHEDVRRTQHRLALLVELNDRFRVLDDPADISFAAAELLGEALGVSRAGYGTIDTAEETITIERDWNAPGIRSLAGTLHFRDYGSYIEDLKRGETVVFADAETDPRTAGGAEALKAISAQSVVNMPVTEQGGIVALLYLNNATARAWSDDELALIREVAERTRTAVERRRAEHAAKELASRLSIAQRAGQIGAFELLPAEGRIIVSEQFCELWGVPIQPEYPTAKLLELIEEEDRTRIGTGQKVIDSGTLDYIEYRIRRADTGEQRWMARRGEVTTDEEGRTRYLGVSYDITDRKTAELSLQALNETLEAQVAARTEALKRTEEALRQSQKMEAVGQLTGGIAHDFNNMLAIVIGSLDLATRRLAAGRPGAEAYVDNAREGAQRAAALTQRLLAFSRQQPLSPRVLSLNRLVGDMSELLRRTLGEIIALETVLAGGLWLVNVDPHQLESALINLAVNARDAMPDGGRLTIETANTHLDEAYVRDHLGLAPGQYVMIAVTDAGEGIPREALERVFDPFYTTKPVGKGTGLGLSMVYGFVKQSGGHVAIYSEVGQGTTVKIYLPRHLGTGDESGRLVQPASTAAEGGGEVVLVVEDEERVRRMSVDALKELGYAVHEASSGAEALQVLETLPRLDLLFTDVVMAGMTGRQLADRVRERLPSVQVLYTTGYTRNAVVHNGTLDGGVDFLPKPFSIADLAQKVRSVLDRTP